MVTDWQNYPEKASLLSNIIFLELPLICINPVGHTSSSCLPVPEGLPSGCFVGVDTWSPGGTLFTGVSFRPELIFLAE